MWILHEHSCCTSAIDKYFLKETKLEIQNLMKELGYSIENLDTDWYLECYDCEGHTLSFQEYKQSILEDPCGCIRFSGGDYIVIAEFNSDSYARRP